MTRHVNQASDALASFLLACGSKKTRKLLCGESFTGPRGESDVERLLVPLGELHRELGGPQGPEIRRDRFKALELSRMPSLCFEQLLVDAFAHGEQEATRHAARDQRASLPRTDELPQ